MCKELTFFNKQRGAALLVFVFVLLLAITWLVITMAKSGQFAQKISANNYRAEQAAEAAEAGLEFGLIYLGANSSSIVKDADANGDIDSFSNSSTSNVALSNGSKYTITYNNPIANNFSLMQITSVGTSADNVASREVRQLVKYTSAMTTYSPTPLAAKGNISLAGNTIITNTTSATTIISGGTVTIGGNAKTVLSTGTSSTTSSIKSDVGSGNTSLQNASAENFFIQYMGSSSATIKAAANLTYQNSSNTVYNTLLNGKQNVAIWIEQTNGSRAIIDQNTIIGSADSPVLLVVNGDLTIQGNAQIYGYVYATGSVLTAGNSIIRGALVSGGNTVDSGNFSLTYNTSILSKVQQLVGQYAKVPNSWNDIKQ